MDFNAFALIQDALGEELRGQGFQGPEALEYEDGRAVMFATGEVAYALRYQEKAGRFELCSTTLTEAGSPQEWRSLSMWLFDPQTGDRGDAESIANDFLEVIRGPKRVAAVERQRAKRSKGEERTVDPTFFINRLVNLFPDLKDALQEERIVYGQVRPATFLKERVVPQAEALAANGDSEPLRKLCGLLDEIYKNGDLDTRALLTHTLLNSMSDQAFSSLRDQVGEELGKDLKYTRKLKGRDIKPEKARKAGKKVEARLKTN